MKIVNGYEDGAKSVNPDIEVQTAWTNSFVDTQLAQEAAKAMIENGVDVIKHCANAVSYTHLDVYKRQGVERIGDDSAEADAELLAMTVECLLKAGLKEFQVSVGQVDYFKSLLQDANLDIEEEENLRSLISQKNYFRCV